MNRLTFAPDPKKTIVDIFRKWLMSSLLQIIFTGLATGSVYGLLAMGYSLGYSVSGVINFAHGQILMVSAMVVSGIYATWLLGGIFLGLLASTVMGVLVYLVAIRPVIRRSTTGFAWLVSTLGLAIVLQAAMAWLFGTDSRKFPQLLQGSHISIKGASITGQGILAIGCITTVGITLELFRRRSLLGKAAMAVATDSTQAEAVGINSSRVHLVAFGLAGLLAGIAGILVGPTAFANPYMGAGYGVKGFVALLLGGITNPTAAIGGGLILGIFEAISAVVFGPSTVDWFPLVALVLVLLVAPTGVFGSKGLKVKTS